MMLQKAADIRVQCTCAQVVEAVSKFEFVTVGANEEQVRLHRKVMHAIMLQTVPEFARSPVNASCAG